MSKSTFKTSVSLPAGLKQKVKKRQDDLGFSESFSGYAVKLIHDDLLKWEIEERGAYQILSERAKALLAQIQELLARDKPPEETPSAPPAELPPHIKNSIDAVNETHPPDRPPPRRRKSDKSGSSI